MRLKLSKELKAESFFPKRTIVAHCVTLAFYGIDRCIPDAQRARVCAAPRQRLDGKIEDLPDLRSHQDPHAPGETQLRESAKGRSQVMDPPGGQRRRIRAGHLASRAGLPPGHDYRGAEFP